MFATSVNHKNHIRNIHYHTFFSGIQHNRLKFINMLNQFGLVGISLEFFPVPFVFLIINLVFLKIPNMNALQFEELQYNKCS